MHFLLLIHVLLTTTTRVITLSILLPFTVSYGIWLIKTLNWILHAQYWIYSTPLLCQFMSANVMWLAPGTSSETFMSIMSESIFSFTTGVDFYISISHVALSHAYISGTSGPRVFSPVVVINDIRWIAEIHLWKGGHQRSTLH